MKQKTMWLAALVCGVAMTACGGGGGGAGGGGSSATGGSVPVAPRSTSGDMLAIAPSRGWNYQGGGLTISLYANPTPLNGITALSGAAVAGSVPTVLTSATAVYNNLLGTLGVIPTASGPQVVSEVSAGSYGAVPGSPILVPNTLTEGQSFSPAPGVTATVVSVGTVPGASACPMPTSDGATVQYAFAGSAYDVSYVPGCGITSFTGPSGRGFTLVSTGQYLVIGELSHGRRVESATLLDTAASLLAQRRSAFPAAALFAH